MNTVECIKSRRSIRKYKSDKVDHALLNRLSPPLLILPLGRIHRLHAI